MIWFAGTVSAVWIVVAFIYLGNQTDLICLITRCSDPQKFLKANELGDFLAGTFAPLAFLWLFIATMLQRQELSLQRQELAETREVLAQQKAELERSANETFEQTKIMKENLRNEGERQIYNEVDIILYSMALYLAANWERSEIVSRVNSGFGSSHFIYIRKIADAVNRDNSDRVFIATLNSLQEKTNYNPKDYKPCSDECQKFVNQSYVELHRLTSDKKYMGNPLVGARLRALKIEEIVSLLSLIKQTFRI